MSSASSESDKLSGEGSLDCWCCAWAIICNTAMYSLTRRPATAICIILSPGHGLGILFSSKDIRSLGILKSHEKSFSKNSAEFTKLTPLHQTILATWRITEWRQPVTSTARCVKPPDEKV